MSSRSWFLVISGMFFIAMAFCIIASITAPAISQIGIAKYNGVTYGSLGYCSDGSCIRASASYHPEDVDNTDAADWLLTHGVRSHLGHVIFIAPIAAGLNFMSSVSSLFMFFLSGPSVSVIFFFLNLILAILAFLATTVVAVIDVLVFFPHVTWCGWLLIPAAVLALVSIPLIFVAHASHSKDDSIYEDMEKPLTRLVADEFDDNESNGDLAKYNRDMDEKLSFNNYRTMQLNNSSTATVLPDPEKVRTNGSSSQLTSDSSLMEKQETRQREDELFDETHEDALTGSGHHESFSAINSDGGRQDNRYSKQFSIPPSSHTPSLDSSAYSQQNLENLRKSATPYILNNNNQEDPLILQDLMENRDPQSKLQSTNSSNFYTENAPNKFNQPYVTEDNRSDITSVSRRGVDPAHIEYYDSGKHLNAKDQLENTSNSNMNQPRAPAPYPVSHYSMDANNSQAQRMVQGPQNMMPNQGMRQGPQQPMHPQMRGPPNGQMRPMNNFHPMQMRNQPQHPQMQGYHQMRNPMQPIQYPMQQNPMQMQYPMQQHPMQQHPMQPMQPMQPAMRSTVGFQPAYKKRIRNKNFMAPSSLGGDNLYNI